MTPDPRPQRVPGSLDVSRGTDDAARSRRTAPRTRALGLLVAAAVGLAVVVAEPPDARSGAPDSAQLVQDANRKVRQRDVAGAIKLLEQAIAADPGNVDAHVRYQDLAREPLGVARLQASYRAAADAKPTDPVAQFLSARLLPAEQAVTELDRLAAQFKSSPWPAAGKARALEDLGRFGDAVVAHGEAVARAGDKASRFVAYRAYGYERAREWTAAAEAWRAAIARDGGDLSARLGLAESLRRAGDPDASLAALDAAAKAGAADPEIAYRRGLAHVDAERWDKAIESFDAAVAGDAAMIEALCAAGQAAIGQARDKARTERRALTEKDLERAIGYGGRAIVLAPESPFAHFVLAAAHETAAEANADVHLDAALRGYDLALERLPLPGPDRVQALTAKSFVHLQRAEWDSALDAAQKAIDIDKSCAVAYGHAGHALAAQGRQQDAVSRCYRPGLKVDPRSARLQHDLGIALWELKKEAEAKRPLEEARTLEPRNGRYRLSLGEYYYATKKNKEAVAELFEATELLPRDPAAWRAYARACCASKSWDECVKAYEKVIELVPETQDEWLYMAVILAEQVKDRERAKKAVQRFREKGGQNAELDDWMNALLGDVTGGN